jgi:hypothetical protein
MLTRKGLFLNVERPDRFRCNVDCCSQTKRLATGNMNTRKEAANPHPKLQESRTLVEPSEFRRSGTIPQPLRRYVSNLNLDALLSVPLLIINNHPSSQQTCKNYTHATKCCRSSKRGDVFRGVLIAENVGGDDTHQVGERNTKASKHNSFSFMGDIVIVPYV